jgi:hypothetical protein
MLDSLECLQNTVMGGASSAVHKVFFSCISDVFEQNNMHYNDNLSHLHRSRDGLASNVRGSIPASENVFYRHCIQMNSGTYKFHMQQISVAPSRRSKEAEA